MSNQIDDKINIMKLNQLVLRCYAKKTDHGWHAVCLDLNLVADGENYKEAADNLHKMAFSYINEALTTNKEYLKDLIPRKAPMYFFGIYYFLRLEEFMFRIARKTIDNFKIFKIMGGFGT